MRLLSQDSRYAEAFVDPRATKQGSVFPQDFVYVPLTRGHTRRMVMQIVSIRDNEDISRGQLIAEASRLQIEGGKASQAILDRIAKIATLELIGEVSDSSIASKSRGVDPLTPVYRCRELDLAQLFPSPKDGRGLCMGVLATEADVTTIPFFISSATDLTKHTAMFGKNDTGKTNTLKIILLRNILSEEPLPIIAFGHKDLWLDNPNDRSTGLRALNHSGIKAFGFDTKHNLRLHPSEVTPNSLFDMTDEFTSTQKHIIKKVASLSPDDWIDVLAGYDVDMDPLSLIRKKKQSGGSALQSTITSISRKMQLIAPIMDSSVPPLVPQILRCIEKKQTLILNTFDLSADEQTLLMKLILKELERSGTLAMTHGKAVQCVIVLDEAQIFMEKMGIRLERFLKECRKAGMSLFMATQNPQSRSMSVGVKGEIHNIISFNLSPANFKELQQIQSDFEAVKDTLTRRISDDRRGVGVALLRSQCFLTRFKVPHFETSARELGLIGVKQLDLFKDFQPTTTLPATTSNVPKRLW